MSNSNEQRKPKRRQNTKKSSQETVRKVVNQGYGDAGASTTKRALKGMTQISGSPAGDIDDYNFTLRQRGRILYMSSPVATSAIRTNRTNVIGEGLRPKSTIDFDFLGLGSDEAERWQKQAEREFALWAEDKRCCDATGINNFYGMQQQALMGWLMSGDVFSLIKRRKPTFLQPYGLRLHLIEADRVESPNMHGPYLWPSTTTVQLDNGNKVYDGVEVDGEGAVVAYHIRNNYPQDGMASPAKWVRVPAYGEHTGLPNVLHVMDTERPEQHRGVPYLAQAIEPLLQINRYTQSELTSAVVESMFTAFITMEGDVGEMPFPEMTPEGEREDEDEVEYEMGPGQINIMKPGENVTFGDPKRPASGFAGFARTIAEQIGAALEVPADLLLKSFNSSYSASRAALLEAWKSFRMRRSWFVDDFCQPVWAIWMSEAVATGRLEAPGFFDDPAIRAAWLRCQWVGPSQGQLDPTKEINAEVAAIEAGLTTRSDAAQRLNGSDFDANVQRLEHENGLLEEAGGVVATTRKQEETQEKGTEGKDE